MISRREANCSAGSSQDLEDSPSELGAGVFLMEKPDNNLIHAIMGVVHYLSMHIVGATAICSSIGVDIFHAHMYFNYNLSSNP